MIYVNSHGRMGNQYFQYAMARSLQLELLKKFNVKHDIMIYFGVEKDQISHTNAIYKQVDKVKKGRLIYIINLISYFFYKTDDKKIKFSKIINKLFNKFGLIYGPVGFVDYKLYKRKDYVLDGYFQSEKYFEKYKKTIIEELKNKDSINPQFDKYYNKLDFKNSVCIHIRRGDYTEDCNVNKFLVCNSIYYNHAIETIKKQIKAPKFYVFSDDINWVKENIEFGQNTIYENYDYSSFENFKVMYSCENFILSNSSYSWWSHYLANSNIVLAPSVWNRETNNKDVYLDNWILININNEVDNK